MKDKQFELTILNHIEMSKTKRQKVFDSLKNWLDKNNTMHTLILPSVVESDHPENKWAIDEIFEWAKEFIEDNAIYGKEGDYYKKYSNPAEKRYTVSIEGMEISGSKEQVIEIGNAVNIPLHYSQTKDQIESISDMHLNHIFNVIQQEVETCKSFEDLLSYMFSPMVKEFLNRHKYEIVPNTSV